MEILESFFGCCVLTPYELNLIVETCKTNNKKTILEINCGNGLNSLLIYIYSRICFYPINVISTCYYDKEFNVFFKWSNVENIKAEEAVEKYKNVVIFSSWPRYNFLRNTIKKALNFDPKTIFIFVGEQKKNGDICFKSEDFNNLKIIDEQIVKINLVNVKQPVKICVCVQN